MITVLIPAYNEEGTIKETIINIKGIPEISKVLVVDDCSLDQTFNEAQKGNPDILIRLEKNRGKGGALNALIPYVDTPFVAMVDADLGESAKELIKLIHPVIKGEYDIAIAGFPKKKKGGLGITMTVAKKGMKWRTGLDFQFPLSGQRVMTLDLFKACTPFAPGFGVETYMNLIIAKKGYKFIEVETNMSHRYTGNDLKGYFHRGKQCLAIIKELIRGVK
ncbi:Glycosyl transferase family 2 [Anaerobranca californiensis DSM 14826]|jgi:glycosyltransferase involved in cell wall biosynthesis|uniref:Glycosyl transferase family 2 n=1 Tax=Anaerobranca californiensis DSM 14826 TaxID=1120989 RepID=A0A1M6L5I6_9FIRM|nr:glycosyltransferase family 2 protein [Anaerobranca californiensis]SHJ66455.1 Glycosyl transferase family 2 [Anaerobranca californiensis DSM 14826]